jgi:hypothetical protein
MGHLLRKLRNLWSTDRGLSVLVLLLVVTIFVLPQLAPVSAPLFTLLFDILFSLILLAGLTAITRTRGVVVAGLLFTLLALLGRWVDRGVPGTGLMVLNLSTSLIASLVLACLLVIQVFREGPITIHRILGSVGVYLLLGLAWSFAYQLIDVAIPDAFAVSGSDLPRFLSESEFLYFSFVTLTTIGYGDITALHPAARSVVLLEGLTGQLYPAILIARLVSMEFATRDR